MVAVNVTDSRAASIEVMPIRERSPSHNSDVFGFCSPRRSTEMIQREFVAILLGRPDTTRFHALASVATTGPSWPFVSRDSIMRIHDWSRVDDGTFHHFHHSWIEEIQRALNGGLLPSWLYALAEQQVSEFGPDVLALQVPDAGDGPDLGDSSTGLLVAPPRVKMTVQGTQEFYAHRQKSVVLRHASDDRIVAIVEVVSPGNKSSRQRLEAFVRKACSLLHQGIHLLILDLHLPTRRAPEGIHGAIWSSISSGDDDYRQPVDQPLTLVAYQSRLFAGVTAYIEPIAINDPLPEMPLYVSTEGYVSVPLQATYDRAFAALPRRWASVLEL